MADSLCVTGEFYGLLRSEVVQGNPYLSDEEQAMLRGHYRVMMNPDRYPTELATSIYVCRRSHPVSAIVSNASPVVFDAGCGYGSESFLFASLGARVLAVDRSSAQIDIAVKRKRYFEDKLGKKLDITFRVADLNAYIPEMKALSLTWIASVLAAIPDQDLLLKRICGATRAGGRVIVTDMNLLNPLFLLREWRRRRRARRTCPEFARHADFSGMLRRRGRGGARYFGENGEGRFDDVQFFCPHTLSHLLAATGFKVEHISFSGFVPPLRPGTAACAAEKFLSKVPLLKTLGYFYTVGGIKQVGT